MNNINDKKRDLARDEGGAILIMGLAMILGLVGFLWFLLGIGETLAFRDHMQESADSAAFTQPAVEALCMNMIVLINIIMMVMVALYIVWSIVVTVAWADSVLCCPDFPASIVCCPAIIGYYEAWDSRNDGASAMAGIDGILSPLQSIIGMAAPWAGTGLSYLSSSDYKMSSMQSKPIGFAISEMNIALSLQLGSTTAQFGLPVTHDYLGNDCSHLFEIAIGALTSALGGKASKGIGKIANKFGGVVGAAVQWYYCDNALLPNFSAIAKGLTQSGDASNTQTGQTGTDANGNPINQSVTPPKFPPDPPAGGGGGGGGTCNTTNGLSTAGGIERVIIGGGDGGNYWNCGSYGPMMDYKHGKGGGAKNPPELGHKKEYKNGADEMQSFALLFIPNAYSDHHATHNIQMMQLHNAGWSAGDDSSTPGSASAPKTYGYYAQGELYFDCEDKWASASCDDTVDGTSGGTDIVLYKFEWRARLVKVHFPGGIGQMVSFLNSVLGMVSSVRSFINGPGADEIVKALNFIDPGIVNQIGSIADPIPAALAH